MKRFLAVPAIAFFSLALLAGCGSTKQLEASLAEKEATVVTLGKENQELRTENGKMKARVGELEKDIIKGNARAIDLERQLDQVRTELDRLKAVPSKGRLEGAYRDALQQFMDRRYEDAISGFEALLAAGMPDPLNDNCHYWIGESYFGLKRYQEAVARFDEVLEFEWSNKKDDSQVMIARCYSRMGEMARAKTEYEKLISTYPASPYIDLAKQRIGTM